MYSKAQSYIKFQQLAEIVPIFLPKVFKWSVFRTVFRNFSTFVRLMQLQKCP